MKNAILYRNTLRGFAEVASKEETRYYMQGVFVEIRPKDVTYVATDGHILLVTNRKGIDYEVENTLVGNFIIPNDICRDKRLINKNLNEVLLEEKDDLLLDNSLLFKPINGTFPPWKEVIPTTFSGEVAQFSADKLSKLQKAARIVIGKTASKGHITHNGDGPALIRWNDEELLGIIMPYRNSNEEYTGLPAWMLQT